jgi:hypothetical protein
MHKIISIMEVKEKSVFIRYDGEINSELCRGLILAVHNQMNTREANLLIRKRITHIITECLLNLSHHAEADTLKDGKYVEVAVDETPHAYSICTCNLLSTKKINFLTSRLEKINEMNANELYQHYMTQLQSGQYTNKGTAGLGFIDIARKSGNKLVFDFQAYNETMSLFTFKIVVNKFKNI